MFKELFALRVLVASFTTICIFKLTSPFINVWLGAEYILPQNTVAIIALYSGICIGRGVTDQFLHAYGLYADIWSPYIESAIMILVAVICGYAGGLPGVLCGPVASMGIVIYIWKPYYLFHSGLHISVFKYWSRLFRRNTMNDWAFCLPKNIYWGEDAIMNLRIAFNTKKDIVILKQALYFYRQASDGVCNNFKANPLYEEELRKHCYDSIPQKDFNDYKEAYLYRRVFLWRTKFNNSIHPEWANTPFYDTLIKEIKAYDFHLDLFDRLLINHTHPIIRCLILFIRKTASTINRLVLINKHI